MNEALQKLEIKVENGGSTPQGRVSAAEWNVLVAGVKALDLAGFDENALRDYLDQYDYITRPELDKALEGIGGGSGGSGIAYLLTWSGFSQGMWDGSAPANIAIPSLLSQLTNDSDYITTASVNSLLTDYVQKSGLPVYGLRASSSIGKVYLQKDGVDVANATLALPTKLSQFTDDMVDGNYLSMTSYAYELNPNEILDSRTARIYPLVQIFTEDNIGSYRKGLLRVSGGDSESQLLFDHASGTMFYRRIGNIINHEGWREIAFTDSTMYPTGDIAIQFPNGEYFDKYGNIHFSEKSGAWSVLYPSGENLFIVYADGTVETTGHLTSRGTIYLRDIDDKAIEFPEGEYMDKWGNIVLPSTASQWSVKKGSDVLMKIGVDGKITASDSFNVGKTNGVLFSIVADWQNWQNVDIISKLWDDSRWDYVKITTPTTYSRNSSINICARGYVEVVGDFFATGEITQHSSLKLKDVVDTRFLTLEELAELKPYSFRWKDKRDGKLHAGAIADYVMPILPEVISTDKDNIHSMNYANAAWIVGTSLTPYVNNLVEEMKRLESRIKYLESRLKEC